MENAAASYAEVLALHVLDSHCILVYRPILSSYPRDTLSPISEDIRFSATRSFAQDTRDEQPIRKIEYRSCHPIRATPRRPASRNAVRCLKDAREQISYRFGKRQPGFGKQPLPEAEKAL